MAISRAQSSICSPHLYTPPYAMDGIRFILEDPQAANSRQKKRSRLVTACDSCRAKKIKCHQSPGSTKCEACRVSKNACRFRDRERYHAQRSGNLSASSSTFNPSDSEDMHPHTVSPIPITRRATMPNLSHFHAQHIRSSSLPPALPRLPFIPNGDTAHSTLPLSGSLGSRTGLECRSTSSLRQVIDLPATSMAYFCAEGDNSSTGSSPSWLGISPVVGLRGLSVEERPKDALNLFDSCRPDFPAAEYINHAIDVFFDYFGHHFRFLHRDALRQSTKDGSLPAPLANCVAALAFRFSHWTEISGISRLQLGEPFLDMAKDLMIPTVYSPTIEGLHSLLLLSWCEYGSGRENGLNLYSALAVQTANELGLGIEHTIQAAPALSDQMDLRQTWWDVVLLDILSSWVSGNPPNVNLQGCTTTISAAMSVASTTTLPYVILHELLHIRDQLLQIVNISFNMNIQQNHEADLREIVTGLQAIQASLPSQLKFDIANFRRAVQEQQGTIFIFLHLILNSLLVMSHCPSIFRSLPIPPRIPDVVLSAAHAILDAVVTMEKLDMRTVSTVPFLDFPLAIAARVFMLQNCAENEITPSREHLPIIARGRLSHTSLERSTNLLTNLARYWGNVQNVQSGIQSGTVWTYICPVRQSPVVFPSALDLHGVETSTHVPQLQLVASEEPSDFTLTGSDSELSREPSPLIFNFPGLYKPAANQKLGHHGGIQRPASGASGPTLLDSMPLPPVGNVRYEDISVYMNSFADDGHPSVSQEVEYFSSFHGEEYVQSPNYGTQEINVPTALHPSSSQWLYS